jgi:response regulator RpfG family c-di-GMP phosphodiesterase
MRAGSVKILDKLLAEGLLTLEKQEAALSHVQRTGERVEEALLDIAALDEAALLKFLASHYQTRFVSTEKLAKADIDRATLEMVPKKIAERDAIFPVLFDRESGVLSVVTPDPSNVDALHDIQVASGVREVRAFVGRPRAVKAAIARAYAGDIHAFATLDRTAHEQFSSMLDVYERNLVSEESLTASLVVEGQPRERLISASELEKARPALSANRSITSDSYLQTLNVLVTLLENSRTGLRGHSAQVARVMRRIADRIGLSDVQRAALMVASYAHDLGKMGSYHLTALNVAEYDGHRASAAKLYAAPLRLMEAVQLPPEVSEALEHMYERFDGKGLPSGSAGKEIPLGARLLAIADTYADLVQNPRNPFRAALSPAQACDALVRYRGTVFDPNLVDLFRQTVTGEDLKARLLHNRHCALIVDADPEETTVLELRMVEHGYEVMQAHTSDQALKLLEQGAVEFVISEIDLQPVDGLALLEHARKQPWGQKLPWIFVTGRAGRAEAQRAFDLGAADYMAKPVSADLLVAKIGQILEREAAAGRAQHGVSGSLQEMGLPDMVQVLWHGRKTGSLKIRSSGSSGEIHFVAGNIYNALWGNLRGEEAFFAMLGLKQGDFALDPNFQAPHAVINVSPEALLLEAMRRLDEA